MFFATLRKQMKWVIIAVVIAFIGGMFYLGVGNVGPQATDAASVAVVNGQPIPYTQFQQLFASNVQAYRQFYGPLQGQATEDLMYMSLNNLIDSHLVYEAARIADLPVADSEVNDVLEELKAGFPDDASYRQALSQAGWTENRLRDRIREDLKVQKLDEQVRAQAELAEDEVADLDEQSVEALRLQAEEEQVRLWLEQLREEADIVINHTQMRARHLVREGKLEEAAEAYQLAMVEDPYNGYLHLSLGAVYEQLGRMDDAIAEYEQAVDANDIDGDLRIRLALAYIDVGREDDAAETLRAAAELNPWDANLQFSLMQLFTTLGLQADAEAAGDRLLEIQRLMFPDELEDETPVDDESGSTVDGTDADHSAGTDFGDEASAAHDTDQ